MKETWEKRISRAERLARDGGEAASLLHFYAGLLGAQKQIFESLAARHLSGRLELDLLLLRDTVPNLLRTVMTLGPHVLADAAEQLLVSGGGTLDGILLTYWRSPSDDQFFAKAVLQPYARWLAETGTAPLGRQLERAQNRCPFCQGKPQLAVLDSADPQANGGGRSLLCSTCLRVWPFPRLLCANCGEANEPRLGYFHSPSYDHVRIEVCDTCRHYQKGIDRSRLGVSVPLVDEVAAAALDLWAREHGYTKIEMNLVGL
ncbi:MAG: formate dehydrogenase accessory protein FdhE [Vicinamibacteria bacterium]